jgi:hypothetical protein
MSDRRILYRTREENAVAQLADSLRNSALSGGTNSHAWSSRIAELEKKVVSARLYATNMLGIAEEVQRYAEEIESLLEAGRVVEVSPQLRIMWGLAVYHARFKAEEYRAMAKIAQGKVKLALARAAKTRINAEWVVGAEELVD